MSLPMPIKNDLYDYPKRFIMQLESGFKFSLDSILLAEFVKIKDNDKVLDMCTGNAPVPLILTTKKKISVVGFEIQKDIASLAIESVKINNLENLVKIINDDIKNIGYYYEAEFFDIITCNPPYFKVSENSYINKNDYLTIARHEIKIDLASIFEIAFKYLKNNGTFYLVHRANRLDDIILYANKNRMNVKEIQFISTKTKEDPTIVLVKCVKNSKTGIKIKKEICIANIKTYQNMFD